MELGENIKDPESVYRQTADKQRIVILGAQSPMITALVTAVLRIYKRHFDLVARHPDNKLTAQSSPESPLIIIQESEHPSSASDILGYRHHIGVINDISPVDVAVINQFADATPKGGMIICSESEPAFSIGKKERPGVTFVSYKPNLHEIENGKIILVSHEKERFPTQLSGELSLRNLGAAKEILNKIGITPHQFYQAAAELRPNT